ncbi:MULTISPECIES: nucleotide pyrophosphohydrolase [Deefgea]|uniref:Nucleotide pyrophosphohydrolase n=1 Tax=Deefgea chitinilytica TaxID=570276 RepID=A0ABS2CFH4_9NEIS|nr:MULTISPECIES: nucleotide pyrophosphohydrolase [Deefgea]MBM5572410.1 nucleotide pyrophosphohydrolase [Deefgea chitinilytica]MBM9889646.1 nucleotide pyrophosphohydrolase [Deefgea sp. CFH1-16]
MTRGDSLQLLIQQVNDFAEARDWRQFHSPKNLSMALTVEAAELLEIFQWVESQDSLVLSDAQRTASAHEAADILLYLLRFCEMTQIDLLAAAREKLQLNAQKYPLELSKGVASR